MPKKKGKIVKKHSFKKKSANFYRKTSRQLLGALFILLSIVFLYGVPLPAKKVNKEPISIDSKLFLKKDKKQEAVRIIIPRININLPIVEAPVVDGYWQLSENFASHGQGSANPGEKGNTVIFAHARVNLFYNLRDAQKEDLIYIFTKDKWRAYKVQEITTVFPSQVEVIKPTSNETLTLYTCSGFYDEKRLIVRATPI